MTLAQYDIDLKRPATNDRFAVDRDFFKHYVMTRGVCGCKVPIIHPQNRTLGIWVLIGILFVCYEIVVTPVRVCFDVDAEGFMVYCEAVITVYFILDFITQFFVSWAENMEHKYH